jgi:hypothetical protein
MAEVPVAGSLRAKVIRACAAHNNTCELDCDYRKVEDLGEVAQFDNRSIVARLKENYFLWLHSSQRSAKRS